MNPFEDIFSSASLQAVVPLLFKVIIAVVLAGAIGWEREVHGRPAGLRTHIMLMIGVVLLAEVSKRFGTGDPARIAAQVVTGVGFIGAGAILRTGANIKGLTSAASLWATTGIGMCVSVGGPFLLFAILSTVLALFTLRALVELERRALGRHSFSLHIVAKDRQSLLQAISTATNQGVTISSMKVVDQESCVESVVTFARTKIDLASIIAMQAGVVAVDMSD